MKRFKIDVIDNWEVAKQSFLFSQYLVCNELDRNMFGQTCLFWLRSSLTLTKLSQEMMNNLMSDSPMNPINVMIPPRGYHNIDQGNEQRRGS